MAGPTTTPAPAQPPGGNGTIDVKPGDLWRVSGNIAAQQTVFDRGAKDLLTSLHEYPDAGGNGDAARKFAEAYMKVGNRWLEVWAKGVTGVGGVAVGFTETANAYTKADAAAHPKPGQSAEQRTPPAVIAKDPSYGKVPDLKWGDDDGGDDFIRSVLEAIPEMVRGVLAEVIRTAFRAGRLVEVYPYPQQHYLNSLSHAWTDTTKCLSMVSGSLMGEVGTITNPQEADWHKAMTVFCSALWGGTDWGRNRIGYSWGHTSPHGQGPRVPTGSQPVMSVLMDTAKAISDILREYAEAAVELNGDIWDEYVEAAKEAAKEVIKDVNLKDGVDVKDAWGLIKGVGRAAKGLLVEWEVNVVLKLDTADINRIVQRYIDKLNALTARFDALMEPLDEAHRSAPKYEAGVARAHGYGARALEEFRPHQRWTEAGTNGNHTFDLAGNEYLGAGGHTLDKHVGKTDEQLAQRLRDQAQDHNNWPEGRRPTIGGSSSFTDMASAQRLTEKNLRLKQAEIDAWLASNPPEGQNKAFTSDLGEVTGRYVGKQPSPDPKDPTKTIPDTGYKDHGLDAKAIDVKKVNTVLKYDSRFDPPYIIYTSMPAP
ncbi:RNase A-like domain-containing protein [Streptomyces sp. NPDC101118]|uniref:RNase A-like domain-containing protein n=1 Tax=Streptomyces sp. NPDC101118 TaxID=3366109 RepID=UPI00382DB60D